jgi:hypothetical protein
MDQPTVRQRRSQNKSDELQGTISSLQANLFLLETSSNNKRGAGGRQVLLRQE